MDSRKLALLLLGSLFLGLSGAIVGQYSFRGNILMASAGVMVFILGNLITEHSSESGRDLKRDLKKIGSEPLSFVKKYLVLGLSALLVGTGFVVGAEAVNSAGRSTMFLSGLLIVSGYVFGHVADKEVLL